MADGCKPMRDSCPPGHELQECNTIGQANHYRCEQCSRLSFQPNENRLGDKCRLRKGCNKRFMEYKMKDGKRMYGSTTEDAACDCQTGYHFENVDQRACVPNIFCDKGFGQGIYGLCEDCLSKNMFSDKSDNKQKCMPLRNCQKEGRCTVKKSNGTFDNECGPLVNDVNYCDTMVPNQLNNNSGEQSDSLVIYASVFGVLFILIGVILIVICHVSKVNRKRKKYEKDESLSQDQLDDIKVKMLDKAEKDKDFCTTVLNTFFRVIEDKINKQTWSLAQELFKDHMQAGKYEVLVQLYKNTEQKYAVNGYLQQWKSWKGDNPEAVNHLVSCLQYCKRDDIVYEVCNKLGSELGVNKKRNYGNNRRKHKSDMILNIFPCVDDKSTKGDVFTHENETSSKLLRQQEPEVKVFRDPLPSAPEMNGETDTVTFSKEYSVPIQASS